MSTIFTDGFEAGFGSWTDSGTVANTIDDTSVVRSGTHSLLVNNASAAQAWLARTITGATTHVVRFYVRITTATSGTCVIYQASNAQGDMRIRVTSGRIIQACINNTAFSGPTLALSQWYRVDARFLTDVVGPSATIDWQIDGSAQTQATRAQTSANMTSANLGIITSVTGRLNFDDILADNSSASYPLGAAGGGNVSVFPGASLGTGASIQTVANVKPSAGRGTGTGMIWVGITGDLIAAPIFALGVTDSLDGIPDITVQPDADPASGTGLANNAGKSSKPSIANAAGTGTAHSATIGQKAVSEVASGLGAAADALPTGAVLGAGGHASGTGATTAAVIDLFNGISEPGLTLLMGMSAGLEYPPDTVLTYAATPVLAVPTYLTPFTDPTWSTTVQRISNVANLVHTYSKRQAFNPSETKIMLGLTSGNRALLDASDYSVINAAVGGDGQWWDDDVLIRANTGSRLFFLYNPTTNTNTGTIRDFSATWASNFDFMTQSSPSDDLRYWLMKGTTGGGQSQVAVWDVILDTIISTLNVTTMPHSGSMSHSGDFIHLNWDATGTGNEEGMWLLGQDLVRLAQLVTKKQHADFQWDTSGNEVFVSVSNTIAPLFDFNAYMYRCSDYNPTAIIVGQNAFRHGHVSGRNSDQPGWAVFSTYDNQTGTDKGTDQVVTIRLDGSEVVRVFAHSHENATSDIVGDATAVPNRDGTKILFHSAWGVLNTSYEYVASV